ncbi:NAD(P)-binding protein [Clavulina sp. PMI_390]|nr:NAD(P)-binding protein [Clavulina sp. PMI_390]
MTFTTTSPSLPVSESNVRDSVVVITGGSSGIGLAVAKASLAAGAKGVVISGRGQARLDGTVKDLVEEFQLSFSVHFRTTRASRVQGRIWSAMRPYHHVDGAVSWETTPRDGLPPANEAHNPAMKRWKLTGDEIKRVLGVPCDVSSWEDNVNLMKTAFETYGQLDYVFANAIGGPPGVDVLADSAKHNIFTKPDFSYTGSMVQSVNHTLHAATPYLASYSSRPIHSMEEYKAQACIANGLARRDRAIVLTGSEAAFEEFDAIPQYAAGKGAFHSLVWSTRSRLEAIGVRLNAFSPSWVDTPLIKPLLDLGILQPSDCIPMGVAVEALMGLFNNSTISGSIRRIPSSGHRAFDTIPQVQRVYTTAHWAPILAEAAAKAQHMQEVEA